MGTGTTVLLNKNIAIDCEGEKQKTFCQNKLFMLYLDNLNYLISICFLKPTLFI